MTSMIQVDQVRNQNGAGASQVGQAWVSRDVSGIRVNNTEYTNNSTDIMYVTVCFQVGGATSSSALGFFVDGYQLLQVYTASGTGGIHG